jgi:two-component system nitrogen regulation response regulator NtrX
MRIAHPIQLQTARDQDMPEEILIVDDELSWCQILKNTLEYVGYRVDIANDGKTALSMFKSKRYDLLLVDLRLPDMSGLDVIHETIPLNPNVPVVMISGQGTIQSAIEAARNGAYDFLEKPVNSDRMLLTIRNALEKRRLEAERRRLLKDNENRYTLVGESTAMRSVREFIRKAAAVNAKVLIAGESGTGKDLLARGIHFNSARAARPFVTLNCAAITETLIESELFGHKRGAFTGAVADKPGRFQTASSGTLFLDEIGDMSLITQSKVLRVLEEEKVDPVGSNRSESVNVRVIAATNRDLRDQIRNGQFREDLFFRLNVLGFKIAPLRERKEDIPLLIDHFNAQLCERQGIPSKRIPGRAINYMVDYPWPGNVRELKNVIEKLIVLGGKEDIQPRDVEAVLRGGIHFYGDDGPSPASLKEAREQFERQHIINALSHCEGNISRAAELLEIPRTYLHKKIKMLGIEPRRDS